MNYVRPRSGKKAPNYLIWLKELPVQQIFE